MITDANATASEAKPAKRRRFTPLRIAVGMAVLLLLSVCLLIGRRHAQLSAALADLESVAGPNRSSIVQRNQFCGFSVQFAPQVDVLVYSTEPWGMQWWDGERPSPLARTDTVSVTSAPLDGRLVDALQALPDLDSLTIWYSPMTINAAAGLAECPLLSRVTLHRVGLNRESLRELVRLPTLERLSIKNEAKLDDEALSELLAAGKLTSLSLANVPRVTPAGIQQLRRMNGLTELTINGAAFDDSFVDALLTIRSLRKLTIYGDAQFSDGAMDRLQSQSSFNVKHYRRPAR